MMLELGNDHFRFGTVIPGSRWERRLEQVARRADIRLKKQVQALHSLQEIFPHGWIGAVNVELGRMQIAVAE